MSEMRPSQPSGLRPSVQPSTLHPQSGPPKIAPVPVQPVKSEDLDPISLVDEPAGSVPAPSKIKALGALGMQKESRYRRQPVTNGTGAVRMRSFHGRLSEEGLAFMDDKINEWLDQHPEVEVKFATTTIGQFEGKVRDLALVVNIWY